MMTRIREEGFHRSQVMETAAALTDTIGPRLTGSPAQRRASEWTRKRLQDWGLADARVEPWGTFGRGWSLERAVVTMVAPDNAPLVALPRAWTPGTNGPKRGRAMRVTLESEADLEKQKGQVRGALLFLAPAREVKTQRKEVLRYSEAQLDELAQFTIPEPRSEKERDEARKRRQFAGMLNRWLAEEGALAVLEPSQRDGGTLRVMGGGSRRPGEPVGVTSLVLAATQYNRILRLLERKTEVELEVDVAASFHDEDLSAANTLADIPGAAREGRGGDAGRAPRLVAHGHRGHRQRRRGGGGDGGGAHPQGDGRPAPSHHSGRPLDGRGAGPPGLARLRGAALRLAARARGPGRARPPVFPAPGPGPAHPEA